MYEPDVYDVTESYDDNQAIVEQEKKEIKILTPKEQIKKFINRHKKGLIISAGIGCVAVLLYAFTFKKDRNEDIITEEDKEVLKERISLGVKRTIEMKQKAKIDEEKQSQTTIDDSDNHIIGDTSITEEQVKAKIKRAAHEVSGHIRNLPTGQHASAEKRKAAEENGVILAEDQTYVEDYHTGNGAA